MRNYAGCWKTPVFVLALTLFPVLGWSQAADELEAILNARELSYAKVARFVLEASGAAALEDPVEAFDYVMERNWLPSHVEADDAARLEGISLLLMQAFGMKGGIFYTFFPTAHNAYRELSYQRIIQDRADPEMVVSGDWLLFMLSRIPAIQSEGAK
jgi:hypothetical protein